MIKEEFYQCVCDADTKETVKLGDCQILEARNGVGTGSSGCTTFLLFLESEQVGLLADTCGQGSGEEEHEETHCLKQCSSFGQFSGFSCAFTRHFGGFEAPSHHARLCCRQCRSHCHHLSRSPSWTLLHCRYWCLFQGRVVKRGFSFSLGLRTLQAWALGPQL